MEDNPDKDTLNPEETVNSTLVEQREGEKKRKRSTVDEFTEEELREIRVAVERKRQEETMKEQLITERKRREEEIKDLKAGIKSFDGARDTLTVNTFCNGQLELFDKSDAHFNNDGNNVAFLKSKLMGRAEVWYRTAMAMQENKELSAREQVKLLRAAHIEPGDVGVAKSLMEHLDQKSRDINEHIEYTRSVMVRIPVSQETEVLKGYVTNFINSLEMELADKVLTAKINSEMMGTVWSLENAYRVAREMAAGLRETRRRKPAGKIAELKVDLQPNLQGEQWGRKCYRCDSPDHLQATCPYSNHKCTKCHKIGHLEAACRSFGSSSRRGSHRRHPYPRREELERLKIANKKMEIQIQALRKSKDEEVKVVPESNLVGRLARANRPIWAWRSAEQLLSLNKTNVLSTGIDSERTVHPATWKKYVTTEINKMEAKLHAIDQLEGSWDERYKRYKQEMGNKEVLDQKLGVRSIQMVSNAVTMSQKPFTFEAIVENEENGASVIEPLLVDSGCTALVIGKSLVQELNLPLEQCDPIGVEYANQAKDQITETTSVVIRIGSYVRRVPFLVGNVGRSIILGVPWLATIIFKTLDWRRGLFEFREEGRNQRYNFKPTWREEKNEGKEPISEGAKRIAVINRAEMKRHIQGARKVFRIDLRKVCEVSEELHRIAIAASVVRKSENEDANSLRVERAMGEAGVQPMIGMKTPIKTRANGNPKRGKRRRKFPSGRMRNGKSRCAAHDWYENAN